MAPILSSATGIAVQVLESLKLQQLLHNVNELYHTYTSKNDSNDTNTTTIVNRAEMISTLINNDTQLTQLCTILQPHINHWYYEEVLDLYHWINVLNMIDSALSYVLKQYASNLLLIPSFHNSSSKHENDPVAVQQDEEDKHPDTIAPPSPPLYATSLEQIQNCPPIIIQQTVVLLQFTTVLLQNSSNKQLYASVQNVSELLSCPHDSIYDAALILLSALAIPTAPYKLLSSDHQGPTLTQLHQATTTSTTTVAYRMNRYHSSTNGSIHYTDVQDRLVMSARGYGTRSVGLGLYTIVTTDNSIYGQGTLPSTLGEVYFSYTPKTGVQQKKDGKTANTNRNNENKKEDDTANYFSAIDNDDDGDEATTTMKEITLSISDIMIQQQHQSLEQSVTTDIDMIGNSTMLQDCTHNTNDIATALDVTMMDTTESTMSTAVDNSNATSNNNSNSGSSKKRRKVTTATTPTATTISHERTSSLGLTSSQAKIKSTAELFFLALERAGTHQVGSGRTMNTISNIPIDKWYMLLSDIRMARSFYSQQDRCTCMKRRLYALITILHTHPSNDALDGYFLAQPDIGSDIADLIRPMVSSAHVSDTNIYNGSSSKNNNNNNFNNVAPGHQDAIANLAGGWDDENNDTSSDVSFELRILAVEALTALIARRDGSSHLSSSSILNGRLQSLLVDLGVGKGQYLGLLPTLIRYSLAALCSTSVDDVARQQHNDVTSVDDTLMTTNVELDQHEQVTETHTSALDVGLAFVEATMEPSLPRNVQVTQSLRFIDSVLTLTSIVVGTSTGLPALVDCGLIPALISTISINPNDAFNNLTHQQDFTLLEMNQIKAWLRNITTQSIQILEPAIVTSSTALSTFHDLKGVDVLIHRLDLEMKDIKKMRLQVDRMELDDVRAGTPNDTMEREQVNTSQRTLLFGILTCLTVVFHQESNSETSLTAANGSIQLRSNEITECLLEIFMNGYMYGGCLIATATTLLSDGMNNDPHIVAHVLKSNLAQTFLNMLKGTFTLGTSGEQINVPSILPVPELLMAIPNAIAGLGLTEDGAKLVAECNPFPSFLRIFYTKDYVMPQSRCLLNEMTSIIGTGLDEIVRHIDRLKPLVITAICEALTEVVTLASDLCRREEEGVSATDCDMKKCTMENERSCLIQYILNFGQLLEQFLHTEENCEPFLDAGGYDALLNLFPLSMPALHQFLPFVSCLSAPSVSTLHHSTTEEALKTVLKSVESRCDSAKILRKLTVVANRLLDDLEQSENALKSDTNEFFTLDNLPQLPVYKFSRPEDHSQRKHISMYLRGVANVQWIASLIVNKLKAVSHRLSESSLSRLEREWKSEVASDAFTALVGRLAKFFKMARFEVCRIRGDDEFTTNERLRYQKRIPTLRYRLRIVCTEGAVVRDGIEIDSCANIGSLEMGDIVECVDRCINSSGVLRYRTATGWVSEMTRGHGREPISEVINVWEADDNISYLQPDDDATERVEAGIPDIRYVGVGVLARSQANCVDLFVVLSKLVSQSIRNLTLPVDFESSSSGSYICSLTKLLVTGFKQDLSYELVAANSVTEVQVDKNKGISDSGIALYYGSVLNQLNLCLFDEKRERRVVNLPLLVSLLSSDDVDDTADKPFSVQLENIPDTSLALFRAIRFVLRHALADFAQRACKDWELADPEKQRISRSVASSFPPLLSMIRKFSSSLLSSSPIASIMSRLKWADILTLIGSKSIKFSFATVPENEDYFHPESILADFLLCTSNTIFRFCCDERIRFTPPHIFHPFTGLVGDMMTALEEMSKKKLRKSVPRSSDKLRLAKLVRNHQTIISNPAIESERFEISEESVVRLTEMGFNRESAQRALERSGSNQLETVMNYLLSATTNPTGNLENEIRDSRGNDIAEPDENYGVDSNAMEVEAASNQVELDTKEAEQTTTCDLLAKEELERWIDTFPTIICNILSEIPSPSIHRYVQATGRIDCTSTYSEKDGDEESEALTIVMCSFLLELCQKYPKQRTAVVKMVLARMADLISELKVDETLTFRIESQHDAGFSALCHSAVLLLRALPKYRLLVLEICLLRKLVSCVHVVIHSIRVLQGSSASAAVPIWVAPVLLFLDIMAQPIVAFSYEELQSHQSDDSNEDELMQVRSYHRDRMLLISKLTEQWFHFPTSSTEEANTAVVRDDSMNDVGANSYFAKLPAYFALLPADVSKNCVEICKFFLTSSGHTTFSSGLIQSTLFLLLRLLRAPDVALKCLQEGLPEAIITLPTQYSFSGSAGIVTLLLRRFLDDESSLLSMMENEIRSIVTKLQPKSNIISKDEIPKVSLPTFIEAVTPLVCRDPVVFFKAMTLTVTVEPTKLQTQSHLSVALIPTSARGTVQNTADKKYSEGLVQTLHEENKEDAMQQYSSNGLLSKDKHTSRSPRHATQNKKGKKGKEDTPKIKKNDTKLTTLETPASRITGLLMNAIVTSLSLIHGKEANYFLSPYELIDILSDLVLAIPACASAVHSQRQYRSRDKSRKVCFSLSVDHALTGCPSPPRTFVTFLLHHVLPQNKWKIRNDTQIWNRESSKTANLKPDHVKVKQKSAYNILKTSQYTGRLLLALVLRPGEGRKRVISDLTFALSGGRLGHGSCPVAGDCDSISISSPPMNAELNALVAWGELCTAFAAPKSNGKNLDGMTSLNMDNIRIMLESGVVHALLYALHRFKMLHPMSSCGALLLPIEILTRNSVSDAIESIVKKELQLDTENDKNTKSLIVKGSTDGAHTHTEEEVLLDVNRNEDEDLEIRYDVLVEVESNVMDDVGSRDVDGMIEDDPDEDDDDDEEVSDGEESEEADEGEEESVDDSEEEDMDDDDTSDGSESDDGTDESREVDDEAEWDADNHNSYEPESPMYEAEAEGEDEEEITEGHEDTAVEEGWTRIEATGLGGVSIERNRGGDVLRSRRFGLVDAAEAMINSLMRDEDISNHALAEIEGTLGIRIMRGRSRMTLGNERSGVEALTSRLLQRHVDVPSSSNSGNAQNDVVGTIPQVSQRNQPVVFSGSNRIDVEVSSMEYVFGGPTVTGSDYNYDVTTTIKRTRDFEEDDFNLTLSDLNIFPYGPVTTSTIRAQYSLHPLLCGIDLPPMNSLVSDLTPHGARSRRTGNATTRRSGEWQSAFPSSFPGYLFSTSNGNIVRSNRTNSAGGFGANNPDRNPFSLLGFADDGLPIDNTIQEFSVALEATLTERARNASTIREELTDQGAVNISQPMDVHTQRNLTGTDVTQSIESQAASVVVANPPEPLEGMRSDSEGVATSVAELRLSVENESLEQHDPNDPEVLDVAQSTEQIFLSEGHSLPHENVEHVGDESNNHEAPSEENLNDPEFPNDGQQEHHSLSVVDSSDGPAIAPNTNGLICPPDVDIDVFNSLPFEMQQDCIDQYSATQELAEQLNGSSLDPEVLAALPEEMRREVIEQDRQERRMREQDQARADPSNAEEMDNASFLASLSPDLREEILLTADEEFLNSLPPGVVAEAHILRERASALNRRHFETTFDGPAGSIRTRNPTSTQEAPNGDANAPMLRRRQRTGKIRVDINRSNIIYIPSTLHSPFASSDLKALFRLLYLLEPPHPPKILQKIFLNLCSNSVLRSVIVSTIICLLREDSARSLVVLDSFTAAYEDTDTWKKSMDLLFSNQETFPPKLMVGLAPEIPGKGIGKSMPIASSLPKNAFGGADNSPGLSPIIVVRLLDTMLYLCKNPRVCLHTMTNRVVGLSEDSSESSCFEELFELLEKPVFSSSSSNLETLLTLVEAVVAPLSNVSRVVDEKDGELSQRDIDGATAAGKEFVDVPRIEISQRRLQLLCSILRMESCREASFSKVNIIIRRLCRVETNRGYVLTELASIAHVLGNDALRDLRALRIRMDNAAARHIGQATSINIGTDNAKKNNPNSVTGSTSSTVTLSTSTSETKLLRVLQTLHALFNDNAEDNVPKKNENSIVVTDDLAHLLRQMKFDDLWDELSVCLKVVQVLEGVRTFEEEAQKGSDELEIGDDRSTEDAPEKKSKLKNSAAGILTRFLPCIESFLLVNACATRPPISPTKESDSDSEISLDLLVGGSRVLEFVSAHRILINALIRNNAGLLDKGFRALVQVPRCRVLLDFDVKRQWFRSQVRRLRQQASRRYGSLRLHIRRKSVFEDAYHQLQPRNADEMRGRLHVTFRNEEGVDAGGLSREFFSILAKEMFNPNYALFTSTEDGCTFQPNPNSMINPDHLSYFRFVGRVVGKAVVDGFLLDAHFTRSLYKHMLGIQPTHHDMEAIDPDYYRNLKTILEYNLGDIGLDLTFSIEDHSFGRSQVIDLIPNGRTVPVTEENKEEYVRLVCQHRMTTSIQSQIKSYLAGFYDLVSPELITIFSPRELELLISGLPDIDIHDLKEHTDYVGWKSTDTEIVWFWNIVFSLSRNEKASFLQFVTGSSKVPLSGFADLQGMRGIQKFSIHKMNGKKGALMSAHTCFNSLDLPTYDSEDEMRQKFLFAINEGGGGFLFA